MDPRSALNMTDIRHIALNGPETLNKAMSRVEAGERVVLTRGGDEVASVVEPGAAALLDDLEDAELLRAAEESDAEHEASGEELTDADELYRELGI